MAFDGSGVAAELPPNAYIEARLLATPPVVEMLDGPRRPGPSWAMASNTRISPLTFLGLTLQLGLVLGLTLIYADGCRADCT